MNLSKDQLQELVKQKTKRNVLAREFLLKMKRTRKLGKEIQVKVEDDKVANQLLKDM